MELLHDLIRGRALERLLGRVRTGDPSPVRPVSPALPAARALHRAVDGTGDVFSLRRASPAAALSLGATPAELFRQAAGRASAPAAGRDAGGLPTALDRGLLSPVELPGVLVQVLAGMAMTFRRRGEARVALLVDDLAGSDAGDWHEGLAVAAARRAPLVLVVRGPAASGAEAPAGHGSSGHRISAPVPLTERADGYGVQARAVDGQDPRAVENIVWQAVEAARTGHGPQLVQVATPPRDPVDWLAETLVAAGAMEPDRIDDLEAAAHDEMTAAWETVRDEPEPAGDEVAGGNPELLRRSWCRWEGAA